MKRQEQPRSGGIHNYFYGPVGQFIDYGNHNQFGQQWEDKTVANGAEHIQDIVRQQDEQLPSRKVMSEAVMATVGQHLWWGYRAWAVVYRIYQLKGYEGSISEFVREVEQWPIDIPYTCNYDAVQKPLAEGRLFGMPDKWLQNGAQAQAVLLGETLLKMVEQKMTKEWAVVAKDS